MNACLISPYDWMFPRPMLSSRNCHSIFEMNQLMYEKKRYTRSKHIDIACLSSFLIILDISVESRDEIDDMMMNGKEIFSRYQTTVIKAISLQFLNNSVMRVFQLLGLSRSVPHIFRF